MFGLENLMKKYPTRAIIFEMRGNSTRMVFDFIGRTKRTDGTEVMTFKTIKDSNGKPDKFPAPTNDYYMTTPKGRSVLLLVSPKSSVYIPVKPDMYVVKQNDGTEEMINAENIGVALHLADSKIDEWAALEAQRTLELTKPELPWWQANFPMIAVMIVCGLLAFVMIFAFGPIEHLAASLSQTSANILETVKLQATLGFGGGPVPKVI